MSEIVGFHSLLNMERSSNRISIRSKSIQSELNDDIQSESSDSLRSPYAGLNAAVKAT